MNQKFILTANELSEKLFGKNHYIVSVEKKLANNQFEYTFEVYNRND